MLSVSTHPLPPQLVVVVITASSFLLLFGVVPSCSAAASAAQGGPLLHRSSTIHHRSPIATPEKHEHNNDNNGMTTGENPHHHQPNDPPGIPVASTIQEFASQHQLDASEEDALAGLTSTIVEDDPEAVMVWIGEYVGVAKQTPCTLNLYILIHQSEHYSAWMRQHHGDPAITAASTVTAAWDRGKVYASERVLLKLKFLAQLHSKLLEEKREKGGSWSAQKHAQVDYSLVSYERGFHNAHQLYEELTSSDQAKKLIRCIMDARTAALTVQSAIEAFSGRLPAGWDTLNWHEEKEIMDTVLGVFESTLVIDHDEEGMENNVVIRTYRLSEITSDNTNAVVAQYFHSIAKELEMGSYTASAASAKMTVGGYLLDVVVERLLRAELGVLATLLYRHGDLVAMPRRNSPQILKQFELRYNQLFSSHKGPEVVVNGDQWTA